MKHRRGIFIKMFVWFWVVMTVVITITILIDRFTGTAPWERHLQRHLEVLLKTTGKMAVGFWEKGDRSGLAQVIRNLQQSAGLTTYLLSAEGREVQGKALPKEVTDLVAQVRQKQKTSFITDKDKVLGAVRIGGSGGRDFLFAGAFPLKYLNPPGDELWFIFQRLAIALIISCLACYLLARYLTVPIVRLGEAARRLASGDLKVRISPAEGKRWDEIGELAHDFDLMAERITSLITSQKQLLANISHELRSPLARLNVALELARKASTPESEKSLQRMEWEAERLNELIGRLLAFSRLDSALEEVKKEPVDLQALVKEIVDDADFEARGRNREVLLKKTEPCLVSGESRMVRSAIENVIRNAVFYTREGTAVTVSLEGRIIAGESWTTLQVRDQGPGVPEEALVELFRPFYRPARTDDRQGGGSGLGLAITERAVQLHDGTVKAWNAKEGGLVVEITLPLLSAKSS
ncbi:MAG: ATP-binding protein [Thermodesulfobacteriota bacterium]